MRSATEERIREAELVARLIAHEIMSHILDYEGEMIDGIAESLMKGLGARGLEELAYLWELGDA